MYRPVSGEFPLPSVRLYPGGDRQVLAASYIYLRPLLFYADRFRPDDWANSKRIAVNQNHYGTCVDMCAIFVPPLLRGK